MPSFIDGNLSETQLTSMLAVLVSSRPWLSLSISALALAMGRDRKIVQKDVTLEDHNLRR